MLFYINVIILLWLSFMLSLNKERRSLFELLSFILLTCIAANSHFNGWDSYTYQNYFNIFSIYDMRNAIEVLQSAGVEPLYILLLALSSQITDNYQFYIALQSLIINALIFLGIRRIGVNYTFFAIIFFCSIYTRLELSTFRQGIAFSIFVFSLHKLLNNKKSFFIYIMIGGLFHYSLLPMAFLWFIRRIKTHPLVLIGILALPSWYLSTSYFNDFTSLILNGNFGQINDLITHYTQNYRNSGLSLVMLFNLSLYFIVLLAFKMKIDKSNDELFILSFVGFAFLIILEFYFKFLPSLIVTRMEYYFQLFELLLFYSIFTSISKNNRLYVSFLLLPICLVVFFVTFRYEPDRLVYFPYKGYIEYVIFNELPRSQQYIYGLGVDY